MKRKRITHLTAYHYNQPVRFGPHRAMMRPREGHDLSIVAARIELAPAASVRWLRDVEGNSVAVLTFAGAAQTLRLLAEVVVELREDAPIECAVDPVARTYPFQYPPDEQMELVPYRLPSYPYEGPALNGWLRGLYSPGEVIDTFALLHRLNTHIYRSLRYQSHDSPGVRPPTETLRLGGGSCRDYAVLMMEAARYWGFAARFVSGYIQLAEGQHGATHAWTEIYLPGAGWVGFDPTNDKLAGSEHTPVAVARAQEKAMPLSGTWEGPADAFLRMEVSVQVAAL